MSHATIAVESRRGVVVIQLHPQRNQPGGFNFLGVTYYNDLIDYRAAHVVSRKQPLLEGPAASICHDFRNAMIPLGSGLLFELDFMGHRGVEIPWFVVVLADAEVDESHCYYRRFRKVVSGPRDKTLSYGTLRDVENTNFTEFLPDTPIFLFDQKRVGEISQVLRSHSCIVSCGLHGRSRVSCAPLVDDSLDALREFRREFGTIPEAG